MGIFSHSFLVIVHQIHIEYLTLFEPEHDAPVAADADAPRSLQITFQSVQAISGKVNVRGMERRVEMSQHVGDPLA
jgi:hypothetical protein